MKYIMKARYPKTCECGADLTKALAVNVYFSVAGHEFNKTANLDESGYLVVPDARIHDGDALDKIHAGTCCTSCDEEIHEFVPEAPTALTYKDVLDRLLMATACELEQHVTVYFGGIDEFYPTTGMWICKDEDGCPAAGILDAGHLYLECDMDNAGT